jgi:hypothetical protein
MAPKDSSVRRRGIDSRILAGYAFLFILFDLVLLLALIPARVGARASGAYDAASVAIVMADMGICLLALMGPRRLQRLGARCCLCVFVGAATVLSIGQVVASVIWPAPGDQPLDQLLGHPNFGLAGSAALCFLAFLSTKRREPEPGHCRACDYDLTGNVSGRCPECGTVVPTEKPTEEAHH